jgi:hypothetical protein
MTRKELITMLDKMLKDAQSYEVAINTEPLDGLGAFRPVPDVDVHIRITPKIPKAKVRRKAAAPPPTR